MCIEFYSQQNDTKIIKFNEGVLNLCPFFWGNVISKLATSVSKVTIDVPQISIFWLPPPPPPPVKCLLLLCFENEDRMNKEKHSLCNFAVLQSQGSYSKKFLPTSIVTFDREANFQNDIGSETWL